MLIAAVLLVALGCLVAGLVLSLGTLLIGSLVASGLAALLLYRAVLGRLWREARNRRRQDAGARRSTLVAEVWVVPGRPRYHRAGCEQLGDQELQAMPLDQAGAAGLIACSLCRPPSA